MTSFTCEDINFDMFADECVMFQCCMCQSLTKLSWNIFGSSLAIFGNLQKFSDKFRKCSETFIRPSDNILKIFRKWSKSSENRQKTSLFVNKIYGCLEISYLFSHVQINISLIDKFHISSQPCIILYFTNPRFIETPVSQRNFRFP